jgi:ferredoxin
LKNKNIDIYCFSGTGNTYLAAKKIATTMERSGCIVSIYDLAKANPKGVSLSHVMGIGFTVAFWNTFPVVKDFINNLPPGNGTEVFVFTTMGDSSLNTAGNFSCVLDDKGYKVIGAQGFSMPNNFIAVQREEKNILKREKAYKKIELFANQLVDGSAKHYKTNMFFKVCFAITNFITNRWKGKIFQKVVRFGLKRNECVKCGTCIKICPVKNIEHGASSYPVFNGMRCQLCMRCISYCQKHAIKSFLLRATYRALSVEEVKKWII